MAVIGFFLGMTTATVVEAAAGGGGGTLTGGGVVGGAPDIFLRPDDVSLKTFLCLTESTKESLGA
jgi:hypothetical protein